MKHLLIFYLLATGMAFAQDFSDPMHTVNDFFRAFHQKDSSALQNHFAKNARLLRSGMKNGQPVVQENDIPRFIRAVATRPNFPQWEERLGKPIVQQHQNLATVWVPFTFYLDQDLSHCGYNSFTLSWNGNQWQILSLIDTATKDCSGLYPIE